MRLSWGFVISILVLASPAFAKSKCEIPLDKLVAIRAFTKLGFDKSIAQRIAASEPSLAAYMYEDELPPIKEKSVRDSARGYLRTFQPSKMRRHTPKMITLYRGLSTQVAQLNDLSDIVLSSEYLKSDEFDFSGNVAWVTPDFEEARAYAVRSPMSAGKEVNFVLEFQVPEFIYYARSEREGFLLSSQFNSLASFLRGVHVITNHYRLNGPTWDDFAELKSARKSVQFVPFARLPKSLREQQLISR
jgi:hypothetical protein